MTANGWLQIGVFLLAVFAVTPVLGGFMARVFSRQKTLARSGDAAARTPHLQADRRRRHARDAVDGVRHRHPDVQRRLAAGALRDAARAARSAAQPAGVWPGRAGPGVQYRRLVHHQHELAGVRRRDDDELFHPDGWARLSQLRLGSGRHLGRDRVHSRHRAAGEGDDRELLGRHGARLSLGVVADRDRRRPFPRVAGRRTESEAVRQGRGHRSADSHHDGRRRQATDEHPQRTDDCPGSGGVTGGHQAVRDQRRRLLQRQQLASVRESHAAVESLCHVRDLRDLIRPHLHARIDDGIAPARLGGLGGDGVPLRRRRDGRLLGRSARQPDAGRRPAPIKPSPRSPPGATWRARRCGSALPIPRSSQP